MSERKSQLKSSDITVHKGNLNSWILLLFVKIILLMCQCQAALFCVFWTYAPLDAKAQQSTKVQYYKKVNCCIVVVFFLPVYMLFNV